MTTMARAFFLAFLLTPIGVAQPAAAIDQLLSRYHELGLFNGSALVADQGRVVMKKGYGLANMEWNLPNAPDTKFRLGSITKQFTATLVLELAEQGKIDLDAPVTRYLPDYPPASGDKIKIHHLLNHTSGIPGYTETPGFGAKMRDSVTPAELMKTFSGLPLFFEPGTHFSYSNSGYFLLGVILEKITGEKYEKLLREKIFDPVGMNDTGYDSTRPLLAHRAAGYDQTFDGSYLNTSYIDMTQPYAAGSLYSTVEDLYKWDQALYTDKVLTEASKARMFTPGLSGYGYAWEIRKRDGATIIEHSGGINGFNTNIRRSPEKKRLIVLLNNTGGAPLGPMTDGIAAILDGKSPEMPRKPAAVELMKTYQASGLEAALGEAREMRAGSRYDAGQGEMGRFAARLLAIGKAADGLTVALQIEKESPKSAGVASLVASAYRANGKKLEAIQALSKAIELSPTPRALLMQMDEMRELANMQPK